YFYNKLKSLDFFNMYNLDGHGNIEELFYSESEAFVSDGQLATVKSAFKHTNKYNKDDLIAALENKDIQMEFQPIISVETMNIVAVEGLIRWDKESDSSLLIDQFEYHNLTHLSFKYLLNEICYRIKQSKHTIIFSMNLSV